MKPKQQYAPLNIPLADDDTDDRFFFDKALREIPIVTHLRAVHQGEQLMNFLSENSEHLPDVLFLDLSTPRKTGFECLSEIKQNKKLQDLPVVMFSTSYPQDIKYEWNMINMLYKMGANDYIRKPGDFAQLKKIIHNALIRVTEKRSLNGTIGALLKKHPDLFVAFEDKDEAAEIINRSKKTFAGRSIVYRGEDFTSFRLMPEEPIRDDFDYNDEEEENEQDFTDAINEYNERVK